MKLSILVCSVHTRRNTFLPLMLDQLYGQYEKLTPEQQNEVEIIVLIDNKKVMLGTKRNYMVDIAQGEYVVFVDDDDRISDKYISSILCKCGEHDVISFPVMVSLNGERPKPCYYSIGYEKDANFDTHYERLPNHICAVKRKIVKKVDFPAIPYGEDSGYSKELIKHLKSQVKIYEVLYWYNYNSETTETQQHLNNNKKRLKR